MAQDNEPRPVRNAIARFADIVTIPAAIGASAYTFVSKTSDELYDLLRDAPQIKGMSRNPAENPEYYETALELGNSAKDLFKMHHKNWSKHYEVQLKDMGIKKNVFERFSMLHRNQKLEVIVHTVTAGALIVGFWALLDQLRSNNKESEKSR